MKRIAIAIVLLIVVVAIAWLARSSRCTETPSPVEQAPATSAATQPTTAPITSNAPEAPRASIPPVTSPQPETSVPSSPPLDSAEILVRGLVRDERNQPATSGWLAWIDERGIETTAELSTGAYSVAGLHAGRYLVRPGGSGWRAEQFDVSLDAQPAIQQRDFTVHASARVRIRITGPDGAPLLGFDEDKQALPGNLLRAYASRRAPAAQLDPDALVRQASSDCGRFVNRWNLKRERASLEDDCLGELELVEPPPLCVSLVLGNCVVATRELSDVPAELRFTLDPRALRSQLAGLRVRLMQSDGRTPAARGSVMLFADASFSTETDSEGRAELRGKLPGRYELALRAEGAGRRSSVVLTPGELLDLGEVALVPGPKLRLRFLFPADAPDQARFVVKPEHPDDRLATLGALDNVSFSNGGRNPYELAALDPGTYELRVLGLGDPRERAPPRFGARPMRVTLGDAAPEEYVVRIERTTVICLRPPHDAQGISRWLVSTPDGLPCQRVRVEGRTPTRIELVPGAYTIARIDPETRAVAAALPFTVGSEFQTLDLGP